MITLGLTKSQAESVIAALDYYVDREDVDVDVYDVLDCIKDKYDEEYGTN